MEAVWGLHPNCEPASAAFQGILLRQQTATRWHTANAQAIAEIAEESNVEVLLGTLDHASYGREWQLDEMDFGPHRDKYQHSLRRSSRSLTVLAYVWRQGGGVAQDLRKYPLNRASICGIIIIQAIAYP